MDAKERYDLIQRETKAFQRQLTTDPDAPIFIRLAVEHIHKNLFSCSLSVSIVLQEIGAYSHRFSANFTQHMGCTIGQYIRNLRIEAAKVLLKHRDLPIADIGFAVGYEVVSTLRRNFKTVEGCSARVYRKKTSASGGGRG